MIATLTKISHNFAVRPTREHVKKYVEGSTEYCPIAQTLIARYGKYYSYGVCHENIDVIEPTGVWYIYNPVSAGDAESLIQFVDAVDTAMEDADRDAINKIPLPWIHFSLHSVLDR